MHLVHFSLLRIRNAFDSMSTWCSVGYGWSEPFDSKNGCRRGSWKKCSEDEWYCVTCSGGVLEPRLDIELESAELERYGMERSCDGLCSDANLDAHVADHCDSWSERRTRAVHAKKIEMPSKVQKSAMGGQEKIVGERADGLRWSGMVSWLHTTMRGRRWLRWRQPVWCPSCDECTNKSGLFDRQQATSCFRCSVMIETVVTVFPRQCCGVLT